MKCLLGGPSGARMRGIGTNFDVELLVPAIPSEDPNTCKRSGREIVELSGQGILSLDTDHGITEHVKKPSVLSSATAVVCRGYRHAPGNIPARAARKTSSTTDQAQHPLCP